MHAKRFVDTRDLILLLRLMHV